MGFPRHLLDDDEEVVLDLRPHWWFLAGPVALVSTAVVLAVALAGAGAHELLQLPVIGVAVAASVWLAGRYLRWATSGVVLTTGRLILRAGWTGRRSTELSLRRIGELAVRRSLLERTLGTGRIAVTAAPDGSERVLHLVPRPVSVRAEIERCIDEVDAAERAERARSARSGRSLSDELERLDDLRRRGVLSEAEFRAGKARLLGDPQ